MSGKGDAFTCAVCGGRFTKGRSDEEAWNEALDLIPTEQLADVDTVCDPCWLAVMAFIRTNHPELLRATP